MVENSEEDIISASIDVPNGEVNISVEPAPLRVEVVREKPFNKRLVLCLCLFVILVGVVILISLVRWYFSIYDGSQNNQKRMSSVQLSLLEKVRNLWELSNRSDNDLNAREQLRNLERMYPTTCYSALCIETALNFLESMDWEVDPCDDFYTFTCGGWLRKNPPEDPTSVTDHYAKIRDRVIRATQRIVQQHHRPGNKGLRLARSFYKECVDVDHLESEGLEPIYKILESLGGWSLLYGHSKNDEWKGSNFRWIHLVATLHRHSIPSILSIDIRRNFANESNAIYVIKPELFIPREYLVKPERNERVLKAYKQFMIDTAQQLLLWKMNISSNLVINKLRLEEMAEKVIAFEVNIAKLISPNETTISSIKTFNGTAHLQIETEVNWPKPHPRNRLDWGLFLDLVFNGSGVNISPLEPIIVFDLPYIQAITGLIDRTPTETVANYLVWRQLETLTTGSTKELRKIYGIFYKEVYGKERKDRNSTCASITKSKFALAIGSELVKDVRDSFESNLKQEVETLAASVKTRMDGFLVGQSAKFLPTLLKSAIREELTTIKVCVGYPRAFSNKTHLNFYQDLDEEALRDMAYIEKHLELEKWLFLKKMEALRQPFERECWMEKRFWPLIGQAYAYYDPFSDSINLPIGLLQPPFYYEGGKVPFNLKYGGMGFTIGHELAHSFSVEGQIEYIKREQNVGGNYFDEIETLLDCLAKSYSEMDVVELQDSQVDGYRTRDENVADHFGLASAFHAYHQQYGRIKEEQSLPGLERFSSSQMFFISFANEWCDSQTNVSLYHKIESHTHTPSKYRVIGALKNSKDFAQVWGCEEGRKMNPKNKCNLFGA